MSKEIKKMSLSHLMDLLDEMEEQLSNIEEDSSDYESERIKIENFICLICEAINKRAVLTT